MALEFNTDFDPRYGEMVQVSPLLRRMVCKNPSPFTFYGTGTYVIGHGEVAVVDPGPRDLEHIDALVRALDSETVSAILVTHTHGDHSPAAAALSDAFAAPVLGFGPHPRNAISEEEDAGANNKASDDADSEAGAKKAGAKEAVAHGPDIDFNPDQRLKHGDMVTGPGWTVQALHTPGHISNHLCFALAEENAVLTGDHVMGWSTTIIPPPDGDAGDYLRSLQLLLDRRDEWLYPTHGAPINNPRPYVSALLDHRLKRETQILEQLHLGPASANQIVEVLYANVRVELHPLAARSVVAHLIKLNNEHRTIRVDSAASITSSDTVWVFN